MKQEITERAPVEEASIPSRMRVAVSVENAGKRASEALSYEVPEP